MQQIVTLFIILLLFSCKGEEKQIDLLATIHPYFLVLQELAGDRMSVGVLMPPNASPHTYSPTPSDIRKLQKARLVVANGLGLEGALLRRLITMKERTIFAGPSVYMHRDHHVHEHALDTGDPHLWMNREALISVAHRIIDRLKKVDPPGKNTYNKNLASFISSLTRVEQKIRKERKKYRNPGILTFHDAFYHFRKQYGIKLIAAVTGSPGRQPSSKHLITIGKKIRKHSLRTIFIEPQLNPKAARIIAREFGLSVAILDPLGATTGVKTIAEHFERSWHTIKKSFAK